MQILAKKPVVFNRYESEMIAFVKKAACLHFEITEDILLGDTSTDVANIRFICYWILANNSALKDYKIGHAFGKSRMAVNYGVGIIDIHKKIYGQTLGNMRKVAAIANNFEKKHAWHIQPINILS